MRAAPRGPGLLARIIRHRGDYLYIAPAIGVMLLVIGYPIYDTVYLSFFNTPPSLAMADKSFVGVDNYLRILGSDAFLEVTINTLDLDRVLDIVRLRAWPGRSTRTGPGVSSGAGCCAASC